MAVNQDLLKLFTGISNQKIDPLTPMTAEQRIMQSGLVGQDLMGRGLRGMLTGDRRSAGEKRQAKQTEVLANFSKLSPENQKGLIASLQAQGQTALAAQLAGQMQKGIQSRQEDQRRMGLISQAKGLGLDETVELLQNGGSLEKAAEDIRNQQEKDIVNKQGRRGKLAIAQSRNAGAPMLKSISKGEYDSLSNEEFLKVISGEKAELKVFTGSDGVSKPYRVNESGKVYNDATQSWVMPSELGLTQAAQVTRTISDADKLAGKLRDKAADNFFVANEKARNAEKILQINANSRSLMEEGIITGAGANFLAGMASIGVQLGLVPKGVEDTLIATQTFMAERGKQVLALLGSGDVGSGTGISDNDVKFMKEVAGQQITLNKETLSRIMRIEEQAARNAIAKSNTYLETMKDFIGEDEDPTLLDTFYVPMPEPTVTGYVPTQAAMDYLQQARERRTKQRPE